MHRPKSAVLIVLALACWAQIINASRHPLEIGDTPTPSAEIPTEASSPTPSPTETSSALITLTELPSASAPITETYTPFLSPSATVTLSTTLSHSATATFLPSSSITHTPSRTRTAKPSTKPSATAKPSATSKPSATRSRTGRPSNSPSKTRAPTAFTPSAKPSRTPSRTPTRENYVAPGAPYFTELMVGAYGLICAEVQWARPAGVCDSCVIKYSLIIDPPVTFDNRVYGVDNPFIVEGPEEEFEFVSLHFNMGYRVALAAIYRGNKLGPYGNSSMLYTMAKFPTGVRLYATNITQSAAVLLFPNIVQGNLPILFYICRVTSSAQNFTTFINGTKDISNVTMAIQLGNLVVNQQYTAVVRGHNIVGPTHTLIWTSFYTLPGPLPAAPNVTWITKNSKRAMLISWRAPPGDPPIKLYNLLLVNLRNVQQTSVPLKKDGPGTTYLFETFSPTGIYNISICAVNPSGAGPYSASVIFYASSAALVSLDSTSSYSTQSTSLPASGIAAIAVFIAVVGLSTLAIVGVVQFRRMNMIYPEPEDERLRSSVVQTRDGVAVSQAAPLSRARIAFSGAH